MTDIEVGETAVEGEVGAEPMPVPPVPPPTLLAKAWARWQRWWFDPVETSTLGVVRIAVGLVLVGWTLALVNDLRTFYGSDGVLPRQPGFDYWYGVLDWFRADEVVFGLWVVLLVAAVCVTVGFHVRIASVITTIGVLSFERRNPYVFNSGDLLVRDLSFYLMLAPSGVALSLDRWRRHRDAFWEFPRRAPWVLRLIQIQLSILYAATVWAKVQGTTWNNGTAISYALRLEDLERFPVPFSVLDSLTLVNLMTYGTLAIELSLAVLVWNRRARPWVLLAGVALHLGIDATIMVGFFSYAVFCGYLAFIDPETMTRFLHRVRGRVRDRQTARST